MNNPHNVLITKEEVENILNYFGPIGGPIDGPLKRLEINNLDFYQRAFVHESYYQVQQQGNFENEQVYVNYLAPCSSEVLEFLGDHILKATLAKYMYDRFGKYEREGFLTRLKIKIEKCSMLHQFALTLGFKKFLLLSLQIENQTLLDKDRGRSTPAYFEDAFEAFLGSIMEDYGTMGYIYAERFLHNIIENVIDFSELISNNDNFKDSIQRWHQQLKFPVPSYFSINQDGPLYRRVFTRILYINKDQFDILDNIQQECIIKYTEATMEYYKKLSTEVYTTLFNKINEGNYILCIGFGKKIVIAEQMAAKQALLNLNLSLNF